MGFAVATIAREHRPILSRFLAWRLGQGPEKIILSFDGSKAPSLPQTYHALSDECLLVAAADGPRWTRDMPIPGALDARDALQSQATPMSEH